MVEGHTGRAGHAPLSAFSREAALSRLASEQFDLLVVGGGITGSGIAREAALRGLRVALVEARDFAGGTSSRSTRLIHGGLRYLRQGEVRLVREAVRERALLRQMAPHLVHPLPFLFPVYRKDPDALLAVRLGIGLYEKLGGLPLRSRDLLLNRQDVLEAMPLLRSDGLQGGARYEDALTDDARLTLAVAQGADAAGAAVANYCRALRYLTSEDGTARGAEVRDEESGDVFLVLAARVVVAVGPWTDAERPGSPPLLRRTKGVHLAFTRQSLPIASACVLRGPDGRLMFAIPDGLVAYIGTTDTDVDSAEADEITPEDARYILDAAGRAFPGAGVDAAAVIGAWAGVRPLVRSRPGAPPSRTSRDYRLVSQGNGISYVAGGKLTAFRAMAERIVDTIFPATRSAEARARSRSPLPGGEVPLPTAEELHRLSRSQSIPATLLARELAPYGCRAPSLTEGLPPGRAGTTADMRLTRMRLRYAVRAEMALHLTDVLWRRTQFLRFGGRGARAGIAPLGAEMAELLAWSDVRQAAEVAAAERSWDAMFRWRR